MSLLAVAQWYMVIQRMHSYHTLVWFDYLSGLVILENECALYKELPADHLAACLLSPSPQAH